MVAYGKTLKDRALAKIGKSNGVGMCQLESRTLAGLPSAFDHDGDGDADAVDAWKRCRQFGKVIPASEIHSLDHVPAGTLAYYGGGSKGHGHVMPTTGGGRAVSTDAGGPGRWAEVDLDFPTERWGMPFLGFVVTYFDGSKLVAQAALPSYLRNPKKQSTPTPPKPGVYLMKKSSIRTFRTFRSKKPMDERTDGPVTRRIRRTGISPVDGLPRGRAKWLTGRWYQLTPDRAKRIGNL